MDRRRLGSADIFGIITLYPMTPDHILQHFQDTNALLEGHFLLSSGLHSPKYLPCALALQYPADAAKFGKAVAEHFLDKDIETVASPAIGGLVIGYAVATALNSRFIWTERQNGEMTLRRGFTLRPGEKILVVEDVITTGGSTRECIAALEANGGEVVGAASIIDRSNGLADVGVPRIALVSLDVPTYTEDLCPMCFNGDRPIKPGSRTPA
ncbi:MAG TPA: orotate phosphoribosyltransferase [Pyrinomonadaceae bacterium]